MKITWIGHATVLIEIGGLRLLTDPVLTSRVGPIRRHGPAIRPEWLSGLDAVLISHGHRDHLHVPSLRMIESSTRVVAPAGMEKVVKGAVFDTVNYLAPGGTIELSGVRINTRSVDHSGFRPLFGPKGKAQGFLIESDDESVYFPGDTGLFGEMAELAGKVSVALLPVGGWGLTMRGGHLDPAAAAEAVKMVSPDCAIPIHWGTLWPIGFRRFRRSRFNGAAWEFQRLAKERSPETVVRVIAPGDTVSLPPGPASAEQV